MVGASDRDDHLYARHVRVAPVGEDGRGPVEDHAAQNGRDVPRVLPGLVRDRADDRRALRHLDIERRSAPLCDDVAVASTPTTDDLNSVVVERACPTTPTRSRRVCRSGRRSCPWCHRPRPRIRSPSMFPSIFRLKRPGSLAGRRCLFTVSEPPAQRSDSEEAVTLLPVRFHVRSLPSQLTWKTSE